MPKIREPLARRYEEFRAGGAGARVADADRQRLLFRTLPPEIELQTHFFAGDFGRVFTTVDGRTVEVVQFGHWNHADGPDFLEAAVSVGGEVRRGAIEIDVDVRGWEQHGHAANPAYEDVVLHLSFQGPEDRRFFVRTPSNREVPAVRLEWPPDASGGGPAPEWLPEARAGRCSAPLESMDAAKVEDLLRSAARFRLEAKARRLRRIEELRGWKQAVHESIAEALGYSRNRVPMRLLAQRLPVATLRRHSGDMEALLFGASGFLDRPTPPEADPEARSYLRDLWERWWRLRGDWAPSAGREPAWVPGGSRPVNHPQRRVGALAAVVGRWPEVLRLLDPDRRFSPGAFSGFLAGLEHSFWNWHHTLASRRSTRRMALVGESRALDILANCIFPLRHGYDDEVWSTYEGLPARLENGSSRRAILRLFGRRTDAARFASRLHQQQGLLQIYQDFCLADQSECADCPFPEQLRQWE